MRERMHSEKVETMREDEAECPYCGWRAELSHEYMAEGAVNGDFTIVKCHICDKLFQLTFNITLTFTTERMEEV